jgi:hypothetical protein
MISFWVKTAALSTLIVLLSLFFADPERAHYQCDLRRTAVAIAIESVPRITKMLSHNPTDLFMKITNLRGE